MCHEKDFGWLTDWLTFFVWSNFSVVHSLIQWYASRSSHFSGSRRCVTLLAAGGWLTPHHQAVCRHRRWCDIIVITTCEPKWCHHLVCEEVISIRRASELVNRSSEWNDAMWRYNPPTSSRALIMMIAARRDSKFQEWMKRHHGRHNNKLIFAQNVVWKFSLIRCFTIRTTTKRKTS